MMILIVIGSIKKDVVRKLKGNLMLAMRTLFYKTFFAN